jgi:hypothetical protein
MSCLKQGEEAPRWGLPSAYLPRALLAILVTAIGLGVGGLLSYSIAAGEASTRNDGATRPTLLPNPVAERSIELRPAPAVHVVSGSLFGSAGPTSRAALETEPIVSLNSRADDFNVILTVFPARVGESELNFFYFDTDGDDRSVDKVAVRIIFRDFSVQPTDFEIDEGHPGHAYLIGALFAHAGNWRVELSLKRTGLSDARVSFDFYIS